MVPDLLSVAKGITSGYVPLSASIARPHLAAAFPEGTTQENVHPNTYAAHPVACAAALANPAHHGAGQPRRERGEDGRSAARGAGERRGEVADRRRGPRPRPHGLRRSRRARRLGPGARRQARGRAGQKGLGSRRHRLRAGQRAAAGPAALHQSARRSISSSASWRRAWRTSSGTARDDSRGRWPALPERPRRRSRDGQHAGVRPRTGRRRQRAVHRRRPHQRPLRPRRGHVGQGHARPRPGDDRGDPPAPPRRHRRLRQHREDAAPLHPPGPPRRGASPIRAW